MKKIALFFILVFIGKAAQSQAYVAKFENGSEIAYDVPVNDPDKAHKLWVGGFGLDRMSLYLLYAKYTLNPKLDLFFNLGYTTSLKLACSPTAVYTFSSKTVDDKKETKIKLKSEYSVGTETRYYVKHLLKVKKTMGLRFGFEYMGFAETWHDTNNVLHTNNMGLTGFIIGFRAARSKFMRMVTFVNNAPRLYQGSRSFAFNTDLVFYPGITNSDPNLTNRTYNPKLSLKLYFDGHISAWGRKSWGFLYGFGIGTNPLSKTKELTISARPLYIYSLGIYGAFL